MRDTYIIIECPRLHRFLAQEYDIGGRCPEAGCSELVFRAAYPYLFPCKHCQALLEAHADTESCLFSPSKFEPMSHDELQAFGLRMLGERQPPLFQRNTTR